MLPTGPRDVARGDGSDFDDYDSDDSSSTYFSTASRRRAGADYTNNRATPGVNIGAIHEALMNLPAIMQAVADNVEGEPDRSWALSVISPFDAGSKGARIPCYQPT